MRCRSGRALADDGQARVEIKVHLQGSVDSGRVSRWAILRQIRIVQEIPKTRVGRVNEELIRDREYRPAAEN